MDMKKKDEENICVWRVYCYIIKQYNINNNTSICYSWLDWSESIAYEMTWNMEVYNMPGFMLYQISLACLPHPRPRTLNYLMIVQKLLIHRVHG